VFAVTDLAAASVGAAALAVATLVARRVGPIPEVRIDRDLAARWFHLSIHPEGWVLPPTREPITGDYEARDGWIRLHTNAPHHREAALLALALDRGDGAVSKEIVAAAVRATSARDLEGRVIEAGGCAAEMRSEQAWAEHSQGEAVAAEPLLAIETVDSGIAPSTWPATPERPVEGIRVLDLTRILAGPVATRFLAGHGAEVLRIDPIDWDEPSLAPEVTLGKRRARLDLRTREGRTVFEGLLAQADVLVHGYRPDALEGLGLGSARRREINPSLVDVCLDAYGWTGPWRARRGFDSLVQMSSGIAAAGMSTLDRSVPTPLPVQALDHATGYILAAAVVRGLIRRIDDGRATSAHASLARTAALLTGHSRPRRRDCTPLRELQATDYFSALEQTPWGPARRLVPPYTIAGSAACWTLPSGNLGDSSPAW
jgi:hypothetical protein